MNTARAFLAAFAIQFGLCPAQAGEETGRRHSLTWSVPEEGKLIELYYFDGREFAESHLLYFDVPEMHLKSGDRLDIYIPDEVKLADRATRLPFGLLPVYGSWLEAEVKIVYHYRGKPLGRRVLTLRFLPRDDMEEAPVSLDGKSYGVGSEAFEKLNKLDWKSTAILDVRVIHEWPHLPQLGGECMPGDFDHILDENHVRINGWVTTWADDKDPWDKKGSAK